MAKGAFILFSLLMIRGSLAAESLPACSPDLTALAQANPKQYRIQRSRCRKPWAALIFMAADNDLTPYAYADLHEMESVGSQANLDIVAQIDDSSAGVRRYEIFRSPRRDYSEKPLEYFRAQGPWSLSSPYEYLPENFPQGIRKKDRGRELHDFLQAAITAHPSDRYWLVIWGHGRGYAGVAFDDSQSTFLSTPTLRKVLTAVNHSHLGNRGFDVLSSDACMMQMVEVAADLAGVTRFVQGSSQAQAYFGLPYRLILAEMAQRFRSSYRLAPVKDLGEDYLLGALIPYLVRHDFKKKFNLAKKNFDFEGENTARTYTSSTIATSPLTRELVPALKALAIALTAVVPLYRPELRQLLTEIPLTPMGGADLAVALGMLEGFARKHRINSLIRAISVAQAALTKSAVAYAYGSYYEEPAQAYPLFHSRAVTLWLPQDEAHYAGNIRSFRGSLFYRWSGWESWLRMLMAPL